MTGTALLCGLVLAVQTSPSSANAPRLVSFQFDGVQSVDAAALRRVMWTPLPTRWPWRTPPIFDRAELERDLARIEAFYAEQGYRDARASLRVVEGAHADVHATIAVVEGTPVRVAAIDLTGLEPLAPDERARLQDQFPLVAGMPVVTEEVLRGAQLALRALLAEGYGDARVNVEQIPTAPKRVRVRYEALAGAPTTFGEVIVTGNRHLRDALVRREVTFRRGDPFSLTALDHTRRRIERLGIVASAAVGPLDAADPDSAPAETTIQIHVTENEPQRRTFNVGVGTQDKVSGEIAWEHLSVFGGARAVRVDATWTSLVQSLRATFMQPTLVRAADVSATAFLASETSGPFDVGTRGGMVEVQRASPGAARWAVDLSGVTQHASWHSDDDSSALSPIGVEQRGSFAALGVTMALAAPPDPVWPRATEYAVSVRVEQAGAWLPGAFDFVAVHVDGSLSQRIGRRAALRSHVAAGSVQRIADAAGVPVARQFFLGGAESLRGWGRDEIPVSSSGAGATPAGGASMLLGSAAVHWRATDLLTGVLFTDAGNVWRRAWQIAPRDLLVDAGVGLRVASPWGPLGVDVGYQLTPLAAGSAAAQRRWRVHARLGSSF